MFHVHRDEFIWRRNWQSVNTTIFRFANSQSSVIPHTAFAHTMCCDGDLSLRLEADPSVFHFDHITEEAGFICAKCTRIQPKQNIENLTFNLFSTSSLDGNCKTDKGNNCVFPYKLDDGTVMNGCYKNPAVPAEFWCPTKVNSDLSFNVTFAQVCNDFCARDGDYWHV